MTPRGGRTTSGVRSSHRPPGRRDLSDLLDAIVEEESAVSANRLPNGTVQVPFIPARDIKAHLDDRVVGQEEAKIQISVLLSMHLGWFKHQERLYPSPNAILIGPTGVGKTHTLRTASEYLKVPFVSVDATSLVPSGIVGLQVEDVLADLVRIAGDIIRQDGREPQNNDDIDLARRGIIFIDEFDKLSTAAGEFSGAFRAVQRRLLKLIEGAVVGVGVSRHDIDRSQARSIDTSGILIIAAGAFSGIDSPKIRSLRPELLKRELSSSNPNIIVTADLVTYGFIPELVARLPVLIQYGALEEKDLREILDDPKLSPAQVWVEHFKRMEPEKEVIIEDDAKDLVAKRAASLSMGARGLQQVLFPYLAKKAYEIEASSEKIHRITTKDLGEVTSALRGGARNGK